MHLSDKKCDNQQGAIRDLALLFAMLPAVYQPTDEKKMNNRVVIGKALLF